MNFTLVHDEPKATIEVLRLLDALSGVQHLHDALWMAIEGAHGCAASDKNALATLAGVISVRLEELKLQIEGEG